MHDANAWLNDLLGQKQILLVGDVVADQRVTGVVVGTAMVTGAVALLDEQGFSPEEIKLILKEATEAMLRKLDEER